MRQRRGIPYTVVTRVLRYEAFRASKIDLGGAKLLAKQSPDRTKLR